MTHNAGQHDVNDVCSHNNNRNNDSNFCNNQRNNVNASFNKSNYQRPFREKCCACNEIGYHSSNCQFIKTLTSCLRYMENNNISTTQVCRVHKMSINNNKRNSKSIITLTLQDDNFMSFETIDTDAFINILEDNTIFHIFDDDHGHE